MDLSLVIKGPAVTEKSTQQTGLGKYTFKVAKEANKGQITQAIEKFFKVNVVSVKTVMVRGKSKRVGRNRLMIKRPDWKKAIVKLKEGEKIDAFEAGDQ